jgi:DNA-binding TFAR19-related protein (PDSD5 family)
MPNSTLSQSRQLKDAAYFRFRAEQTRAISQRILQPDARKVLLDRARDYEELADDLEQQLNGLRHLELLPVRLV